MNVPSRRRLLAGLGSTVVGLATSGCLGGTGGQPRVDGGTTTGSTAAEASGGREAAGTPDGLFEWLPAPSAVDGDPYVVDWGDLAALRELHRADELPGPSYSGAVELLVTRDRPAVVPDRNLETVLRITAEDDGSRLAGTVLATLGVDDAQVEGRLLFAGYDRLDTDREAAVFRAGDVRGRTETVAVLEGVLVRTFDPGGRQVVGTVLDAATGATPRLVDQQPDVATVVSETQGANYRIAGTDPRSAVQAPDDPLSDATAVAYAWTLAPSESTFELAATYPDATRPDADAFTEFVRTDVTGDTYRELSTTTDPGVVLTTGTLDTESFRLFLRAAFASDSGGGESDGTGPGDEETENGETDEQGTDEQGTDGQAAPDAEFAFDHEPSAGTLTVRHDGGDSIDADRLFITADRVAMGTQFANEMATVSAGSSVTVDVSDLSSGTVVSVIWDGPDDGDVVVLGRFRLP